jgi:hypothetical protein
VSADQEAASQSAPFSEVRTLVLVLVVHSGHQKRDAAEKDRSMADLRAVVWAIEAFLCMCFATPSMSVLAS